MNILLLCPLNGNFSNIATQAWEVKKNNKREDLIHPLGLLSIAAYTAKYKISANIKILDFNIMIGAYLDRFGEDISGASRESFWEYCLLETDGFNPGLIGISASFSRNFHELRPLAGFLHERYAGSLVTCGGHLPSACYEELFADGEEIDAICFGEGEKPFLELVNAMEERNEKAYLESNGSWITKNKLLSNKGFKPSNNLIHDLDEIPAFDLNLIVRKGGYANYHVAFIYKEPGYMEKKQLALETTRGCSGKCVFCASHNVHGYKVRAYSAQRIKQDLLHYMGQGINDFYFIDDRLLYNKKQAVELLEFMIERNISSRVAHVEFFSLDEEIAKLLRKAGNEEILITIESANEETLKNIIHKPGNLNSARKAIKCLKDAGIIVYSNILVGFPGETEESIEKGVEKMLDLGCNWYKFFAVSPLQGSELFEICRENNYLAKDLDVYSMDWKKCVIRTPNFEPDYIDRKIYEMNLYVNFVENYDMRTGNYAIALMMFEKVINLVVDTHAFAYYFAAVCAKALGLSEKHVEYKNKYNEMIQKFDFWREWAEYFKLKPL